MISVRSSTVLAAALLVTLATTATVASAHSHHHHHHDDDDDGSGFHYMIYDGKQTQAEAMADCLCWDTKTQTWCHGKHDGPNTGFWRDSCARVVYMNTWWWIPVTVWVLYLLFMPLLMCAFRLCCNCCGGRTPSFGCCCPISNGILSPDPKWTRPYSRCATWTAKIFALIVGITVLDMSIQCFHDNMELNNDVGMISSASERFISEIINRLNFADIPAQNKPSWMNNAAFAVLEKAQTVYPSLQSAMADLAKAQHEDTRHRVLPTNIVVWFVLALVVIVTCVAFCNVRSWCTSISAGLLSFLTIFVLIIASVTMTVAQGADLYCDNRHVVRKFAKEVMTSSENQLCNRTDLNTAGNQTQIQFVRNLCHDFGLAAMMAQSNLTKEFVGVNKTHQYQFCEEKLGGMLVDQQDYVSWQGQDYYLNALSYVTQVDRQWLSSILTSSGWAAIPDDNVGSPMSISECSYTKSCTMYNQSVQIMLQYKLAFYGVQFITSMNRNCNVVDFVADGFVDPMLCTEHGIVSNSRFYWTPIVKLRYNLHNLAGELFGLAVVLTIAFWVWMNGSKRFTKAATQEELLGHHAQQRLRQQQLEYDYHQYNNQTTAVPTSPVQMGTYNDGRNGPAFAQKDANTATSPAAAAPQRSESPVAQPPRTAAVSGTMQDPLLLSHNTPNYNSIAVSNSVNRRQATDVDQEAPAKEAAPQPV